MDSASLRKVLELERQKDFSDTAVFGGLDKFLSRWAAKTESSINSPAALRKFRQLQLEKTGYSLLDKEQRRLKIEEILKFIEEPESSTVKKPVKAAKSSDAPVAKPRRKATVKNGSRHQSRRLHYHHKGGQRCRCRQIQQTGGFYNKGFTVLLPEPPPGL